MPNREAYGQDKPCLFAADTELKECLVSLVGVTDGTVIDALCLLVVFNQAVWQGGLFVRLVLLAELGDLVELVGEFNVATRDLVPHGGSFAEFAAAEGTADLVFVELAADDL